MDEGRLSPKGYPGRGSSPAMVTSLVRTNHEPGEITRRVGQFGRTESMTPRAPEMGVRGKTA